MSRLGRLSAFLLHFHKVINHNEVFSIAAAMRRGVGRSRPETFDAFNQRLGKTGSFRPQTPRTRCRRRLTSAAGNQIGCQ